jgi:hypothetical protein
LFYPGYNNNFAVFMADYTTIPFDNFSNVTVVAVGGFISQYQDVYDAFTAKPSLTIANYQDTLVRALVAAGVWAKLDLLHIYAAHANTNGEAQINWINPGTFDAVLYGTPNPSFVALEGFTSDGANGYIKPGFTPSVNSIKATQNSASLGVYKRTSQAAGIAYDMSCLSPGPYSVIQAYFNCKVVPLRSMRRPPIRAQ